MGSALFSLGRGLMGAFHPRMLLLTFMALAAAVSVWFFVVWQLIDPLLQWVHTQLMLDGQVSEPLEWVSSLVGFSIKGMLVPLVVFVILWPLVASTAVIVASVIVMPFAIAHIARSDFPQLARRGQSAILASIWQAVKASVVFLLGWILTLPLWLIPGAMFILPIFWTSYLLVAVMSFDCLTEHASRAEFRQLYDRHARSAWTIGLGCTLLSLIPLFFFLVPVISALAFTHYYFGHLTRLREQEGVWDTVDNASA